MDIQETGLAILITRDDGHQLYKEISMLLRDHPDWSEFTDRPTFLATGETGLVAPARPMLPVITRILDDLYKRGLT